MDKERLRELFGEFGDRKGFLEKMFGSAYLDHRDDGQLNIPEELQGLVGEGFGVVNAGPLIGRAIEQAPDITCRENQNILLRHLKGYINNNTDTTFEEIYFTMKHGQICTNKKCRRIDFIATFDNQLSPEQMRASFGEEINGWKIE